MLKVVFIDRDGTIIREPRDKQIDTLEKLEFLPGIISGLRLLVEAGFTLVMVSNQDGLGTKRYPKKDFHLVQSKILALLTGEGITFQKIFICPHRKSDRCHCRKPAIGLVRAYLRNHRIDRGNSFVLGDRETDVEFAENIAVRAVRLGKTLSTDAEYVTSDACEACRYIARASRTAVLKRITHETSITTRVVLDGTGEYEISTRIGFFDHMLAQLVRHSGVDLDLNVNGDLHIDEHHTVEDTGIALGKVLRLALGNKRGIQRFGFAAPLDEALAEVAIDLSGRSHLTFSVPFSREKVGQMPTELVEDFFHAFADGIGATIHIRCRGRNDHHKIEAIFKAVARALRQAVGIDRRRRSVLPSTKGKL